MNAREVIASEFQSTNQTVPDFASLLGKIKPDSDESLAEAIQEDSTRMIWRERIAHPERYLPAIRHRAYGAISRRTIIRQHKDSLIEVSGFDAAEAGAVAAAAIEKTTGGTGWVVGIRRDPARLKRAAFWHAPAVLLGIVILGTGAGSIIGWNSSNYWHERSEAAEAQAEKAKAIEQRSGELLAMDRINAIMADPESMAQKTDRQKANYMFVLYLAAWPDGELRYEDFKTFLGVKDD